MMSNSTQRQRAASPTRLLTAIVAMLVLGLVMAAQASAIVKRPVLYQFGKAGTAASVEFEAVDRVAFDQTTKTLYVINKPFTAPERKLYAFKVEGPETYTPVGGAFPILLENLGNDGDIVVNSTTGNIYISSDNTDAVYGFSSAGAPLGGNFPLSPAGAKNFCGIGLDAANNIYVADNTTPSRRLRKFDSAGNAEPAGDISTTPIGNGNICHFDFAANGDLYGAERTGSERLLKSTAAGAYSTFTVIDATSLTREVAINKTSGRILAVKFFELREYNPDDTLFRTFGTFADTFGLTGGPSYFGGAFNETTEELYVGNNQSPRKPLVFGPRRTLPDITTEDATSKTRTTANVAGKIELAGGPEVIECFVQYGVGSQMNTEPGTVPCSPGTPYAAPTTNITAVLTPLKAQTTYGYRVVAKTTNGLNIGNVKTVTTDNAVKAVTTLPASNVTLTTATLNGSLDQDNIAGTTYYFQYGLTTSYSSGSVPVAPPGSPVVGPPAGTSNVSANVSGLTPGKTYNYRLAAVNSHGTTFGANMTFVASTLPGVDNDYAEKVNTDGATLRAEVSPNGYKTEYHFEYGTEDCEIAVCQSSPVGEVGTAQNMLAEVVSFQWAGLEPGQTYHFRAVATNARGTTTGPDRIFKTYLVDPGVDKCENSQARQQSGSSLLLDCRGYELVSAPDAGGFDVISDLVFGQEPLVAYPRAGDSALYSVDSGVIPGAAGSPTNLGRDPYVSTRNTTGDWVTRYVGLPSDAMADPGAFGSPLLGADDSLSTFAFGGKDICDPCFGDGSTNIPVRLGGGSPIEGMTGPSTPPAGERDPSGEVAKYLSGDGTHLIFGATKQFHPDGNNGSVSIYDRNLSTGTTQVASTMPNGATMTGTVGQLDVSEDGSRIVVATRVSTDAAGNEYWHPYMHVGTSKNSIDLAPTSTTGVLYAGMSSDGTEVFFTTKDKLAGDTDTGADLYRATVSGGGPAVITRLSTGAPPPTGDTNACDPVANADGNNWNEVGGASPNNCGVVAIAGGGGVAPENGAVYFLSPEELDGSGTLNEPNLFVVRPGSTPQFVATLEPNNSAIRNAVKDSEIYRYGDFQVNIDGRYAAFNSTISLTAIPAFGQEQIYRYDSDADEIDCGSCAPTLAAATTGTSLSSYGLNLTDDGRVFFTSAESLALRDTNERKDAYEWKDGDVQLVSLGIGPHDSGMLSVSADGTNAFFFTRDTLVEEDSNGSRIKLYVAREGGGFVYTPPPLPCAASDECHGAGTEAPGPPNIKTQTGTGNAQPSRPNCDDLTTRANQNAKKARQARKKAAAASSDSQRSAQLRRARRFEKKAKRLTEQATACRQSSGGNG
jgi:hypothetical protein